MMSVFVETLLLAPLALVWLWGLHRGPGPTSAGGRAATSGTELGTSAMLAFSGVLTGGPLMLFAYAARRIPYATLGLVQYLNPTLQFLVAVAGLRRAFHPLARGRLSADLGRARALFLGELAAASRGSLRQGLDHRQVGVAARIVGGGARCGRSRGARRRHGA